MMTIDDFVNEMNKNAVLSDSYKKYLIALVLAILQSEKSDTGHTTKNKRKGRNKI